MWGREGGQFLKAIVSYFTVSHVTLSYGSPLSGETTRIVLHAVYLFFRSCVLTVVI